MKQIKLNDRFLLVDGVGEDFAMDLTHMVISNEWFLNLKNITEEKASQVVEKKIGYKNYLESTDLVSNYSCFTAIESLHSLIKLKDLHLYENPFPKPLNYDIWAKYGDFTQYGKTLTIDCLRWKEAEEKTYRNPFIFKLC